MRQAIRRGKAAAGSKPAPIIQFYSWPSLIDDMRQALSRAIWRGAAELIEGKVDKKQ
jgi:hypothetical protein